MDNVRRSVQRTINDLKAAILNAVSTDPEAQKVLEERLNNILHLWLSYFPETQMPSSISLEKTGKEPLFTETKIREVSDRGYRHGSIYLPLTFNPHKQKLLAIHSVLTRIIETRLVDHKISSEIAFALLWDLTRDNVLLKQWRKEFPNRRSEHNPSISLGLADYLNSLDKIKNIEGKKTFFFDPFFELFLFYKRLPPDQAELLPYWSVRVRFNELTFNMYKVLKTLCNSGNLSLQELSKRTGLSRQTISKIRRFLVQSFILQERTFFFPNKIGLGNFFLIWRSPTSILNTGLFQKIPNVRSLKYFRGFDNVFLLNFLYPLGEKAETHMRIWSKNLVPRNVDPIGAENEVQINGQPLFAIEREQFRFENLNIDLYDFSRKVWFFENSPAEITFPEPKELPITKIEDREAVKTLLQEIDLDEEKRAEIKIGRSRARTIKKSLIDSGILEKRHVIAPLPDFVQYLILFQTDVDLYKSFISHVAANLPISRVYFLDSVTPYSWTRGRAYGLAIVFIPRNVLNIVLKKTLNIIPHARFVTLPSSLGTSGKVDLIATENGWNAPKLPEINFIQSNETWF
ncbi:MAG: winged helix-turn-helix transcriptional regulator [Methanobacteriota archaeon]|nr:MAG: winged helix-turn-helix transcriptional regulator [Euryarchaeota archaeon]